MSKGPAIATVAAGSVFAYAGIKGYSIPQTIQNIITGKSPVNQVQATGISTPVDPGVPGGLASLGSGTGASIAADALRYAGHPYSYGGSPGQNGTQPFDCSAFTNWVIGHDESMAIPGWGAGKYDGSTHGPDTLMWLAWSGCTTVGHKGSIARPGDLAIWQTHMGICLGPNSMISARNKASGTQVSEIDGFIPELLSIRRLKAVENAGGIAPGKLATI